MKKQNQLNAAMDSNASLSDTTCGQAGQLKHCVRTLMRANVPNVGHALTACFGVFKQTSITMCWKSRTPPGLACFSVARVPASCRLPVLLSRRKTTTLSLSWRCHKSQAVSQPLSKDKDDGYGRDDDSDDAAEARVPVYSSHVSAKQQTS